MIFRDEGKRTDTKSDYQRSLDRHAPWLPEFHVWQQPYRSFGIWRLWICRWDGPYGGRYRHIRLTERGVRKAAVEEIASWTHELDRKMRYKR
jgi:hypothetical protein